MADIDMDDPEALEEGVRNACEENVRLGYMEKVGPDRYRLTEAGKAHVKRMTQ